MLKYLAKGEKNSMKHYAIKFVSAAGRWFSPGNPVCSTMSTDRHDITEISGVKHPNPNPKILIKYLIILCM
jgi:hypothetical protein